MVSRVRAILIPGLVAGVLDLTAASTQTTLRGGTPVRVFKSVATGLLGPDAMRGGAGIATLGVFLHFFIACSVATVFYVASRRLHWMTRYPLVSGPLYGVAVFVVMYFVVVPLSRVPFNLHRTAALVVIAILIHIFCIGLPIALLMAKLSPAHTHADEFRV
jgi:hypothetical protein